MSFWSEASGATKGIIVVGGLLLLGGAAYLLWPEEEHTSERGVTEDTAVSQPE